MTRAEQVEKALTGGVHKRKRVQEEGHGWSTWCGLPNWTPRSPKHTWMLARDLERCPACTQAENKVLDICYAGGRTP